MLDMGRRLYKSSRLPESIRRVVTAGEDSIPHLFIVPVATGVRQSQEGPTV